MTVVGFAILPCDLGLGMFANRNFAADEAILTFSGPFIDFAETKRRGAWECMPIQNDINKYIDTDAPGIFVNHSCFPNAGIKRDLILTSLRPLYKGEEIRFDYSTTMEEASFTMDRKCGHVNCKTIIADFSTLHSQTRQCYIQQGCIMRFVLRSRRSNC